MNSLNRRTFLKEAAAGAALLALAVLLVRPQGLFGEK